MRPLYFLLGSLLLIGCQTNTESNTEKTTYVDTLTIARHVSTLASNEYMGRKPFTEGETKTLAYLENEFESLGIAPGNGDSYFQEVPLVELDAQPSETLQIEGGNQPVSLQVGDEFVAYSERVEAFNEIENSEMVFAGYGVVAPEYDWNDYEGLDVKGKTVIVLVNDPGFGSGDDSFFKGETMTYYGRWTYKYEEAARQGAAGIFIIHDTKPAGYPWLVVRNSWSGASLYLDQTGDNYKPAILGWLTRDAAIKIFEASKVDMTNFVEKSRSRDFQPTALGVSASVSVENIIKKDQSKNVIAKIEGSSKPEETIIYSAHWDHLGVGPEVDGDSIYNGAHDNASGTSMLLALAEAFSKSAQMPERTIVFLAVTAEEQGLLGSKYYAENPIYPVKQTVANINMDGIAYHGPLKDFTVVGYGQSEMDEIAGKYAESQGRYVMPDPDPGKGYFFRSDHFHFARVGIPALYASGTYESMDPEKGTEYIDERNQEYLTNRYHRPADEYDASEWLFGGMQQDGDLYYQVGWELANSQTWPKWKEGSEFKAVREAQ